MIRTRSPYIPILAACFGVFIAADDQVVVVTILPSIMGDFRLGVDDLSQVSWIITAYLLGYTCGMPLIGKLSDVYGHRSVYVAAMLLFAVGSVLCAIANDLWPLVAFRVIQAVGGGAVIPVTIAMIGHLFPPAAEPPPSASSALPPSSAASLGQCGAPSSTASSTGDGSFGLTSLSSPLPFCSCFSWCPVERAGRPP